MASSNSQSLSLVSKCTVFPETKSSLGPLKTLRLRPPMLSAHYIQKGLLFTRPHIPVPSLLSLLKSSLSTTLSLFPPLAGRLTTDSSGHVFIACNDAPEPTSSMPPPPAFPSSTFLSPVHVPDFVKEFFDLDRTVSYDGHFLPILAVQVTELVDGIFIGCAVNHAVTDGTSFWNFFNTFAEVCRGARRISQVPDFRRESVLISPAVLRFPDGSPEVTFSLNAPLRERIFSFSRESILNLKHEVNDNAKLSDHEMDVAVCASLASGDEGEEVTGGEEDDVSDGGEHQAPGRPEARFHCTSGTLFRVYRLTRRQGRWGCRGLRWCAEQLNKSVVAYDDAAVKRVIEDWESDPKCFPLGNFDGAILTMGSSPRFPMYDNNFGWGRPMAIRSGRAANKFDGKISAFPGREGGGSADLEVLLAPETMAGLESDPEFMQYVSGH
ncbi:HXXXD-type acyl-transferase family protein [Actinidia rufa]|uniref:HXXXD-type acyl-transferase family protein n=1 Tax=Actinidia rufa TaxID=165716 RepID=A0A7J0EED9_9ERIC|nr:HXXXD-type acyl-transferase family protein [Actinidia rufa]